MPRPTFRLFFLLLLTCLALGLGACHREVVAPGDPVAAVKGLAEAIRDNDLVRYSRLSVPPALHKQMEERWHAKLAVAPPPTEKERAEFARWMGRLTEPGAEGKLYQSLDPKLKKLEGEIGSQWPLMQTTAGIFINGVINANPKLTASEKAHASEVGSAVMNWLQPQVLTDRARARQAMVVLSATARELDLHTLEQTRQLEMIPALEKGGVLLKGLKDMGRVYGVDGDAALAGVTAKTIAADGDFATMQVSYPLLGKTVSFEMQLIRRDGRWYSADAVRSAEAELSQPLSTAVR